MTKATNQISESVENNIPRKENRYIGYFLCRASNSRTWGCTFGKGYLNDRFDIWNLEENGYRTKRAAEKNAREKILDYQEDGIDIDKASVVKYELAWGPNERGCERPIYMKKVNEYVVYEKGEQE